MARRDDIDRLQGEIEELFADLWQIPRFAGLRQGFRPQVDCYRTEDPPELTIVVELPGVDPASVDIAALPQALVVSGERRRPQVPGRTYQQMEIDYGPFQRQIALPDEVDPAHASASYERGLLTIVLPVAQRPKRAERVPIEVKARP